jgi:hypothetical protein
MIIWRTWYDADMAQSDCYHATKAEALAHIREQYDVPTWKLEPWDLVAGAWCGMMPEDSASGTYCYLERLSIEPTRAGRHRMGADASPASINHTGRAEGCTRFENVDI